MTNICVQSAEKSFRDYNVFIISSSYTVYLFLILKFLTSISFIYNYQQVLIFMLKHKKEYCLQSLIICSCKTLQYTAIMPDKPPMSIYQLV